MEDLLLELLTEFREFNAKLENIEQLLEQIRGSGAYDSISDTNDKLDAIYLHI